MVMHAFSVTEAMVSWLRKMDYEASSDVPGDMPAEFVTVERTGGGASSYVDHPVMAVQCWAPTPERAEALANEVRLRLLTEPPPEGVHSVRANTGPYKFNDPATRRARYQLVLDVACQVAV